MFPRAATLLLVTSLSLLAVVARAEEPKPREELVLAVGEQRTVKVPDVDRMVVTDPQIASVTPAGDGLRVKGSARGTTALKVWSSGGVRTIHVIVK